MSQHHGYLARQIAQDFEFRVKQLQPSLSPELVTRRLLDWTGGQPFLTYRLYELLIQGPLASWALPEEPLPDSAPVFDQEAVWVDSYLQDKLAKSCRDPELLRHLREICTCMISDPRSVQMLKLYRRLLAGRQLKVNLKNYVQRRVVQSGLARVEGEYLVLSNRFYGAVFDRHWLVRAFRTVEARLRGEAVAAIESVFAEKRSFAEEWPGHQVIHPELQDGRLLLADSRQEADCLLLNRPRRPVSVRPKPYRQNHRSVYRMACALMACALGAASIVLMVNLSRDDGQEPFQPPSTFQIREFLRDAVR